MIHSFNFRNNIFWNNIIFEKNIFLLQRTELNDFDHFKLRKARQIRNKLRTDAFYRLKKKIKAGDTASKSTKKTEKK